MNPSSKRARFVKGCDLVLVGMLVGIVFGAARATEGHLNMVTPEATPASNSQPYGGCDEAWQAPQSEGADWCRDHGWTVHKRFVLNRNDVPVALRVNPCQTEDSDGWCYWNAEEQGDGEGNSFIIRGERDGKHRIWWVNFR